MEGGVIPKAEYALPTYRRGEMEMGYCYGLEDRPPGGATPTKALAPTRQNKGFNKQQIIWLVFQASL